MASEISLKSNYVRKYFVKKLIENTRAALKKKNLEAVIEKRGGYFLVKGDNLEETALVLQKIFGIHSVAFAYNFKANSLQEISQKAAQYFKDYLKPKDYFRVKVNRSGKHSFTSTQVEAAIADELIKSIPEIKLNLSKPEKTCSVEVREQEVYLLERCLDGLGGIPVGVEGAVAAFIDSEQDALAAFLFLKRGCNVFPIIEEENNRVVGLLDKLSEFNSFRRFTSTKENRLNELIKERGINAIVNGDTELNRRKFEEFDSRHFLPVLRPLIFYPANLLHEKKILLGV